MVAVLVILLVGMALIGTRLLYLFGVSLDAFMVAGGAVLAWMGFSMLSVGRPRRRVKPRPPSARSRP